MKIYFLSKAHVKITDKKGFKILLWLLFSTVLVTIWMYSKIKLTITTDQLAVTSTQFQVAKLSKMQYYTTNTVLEPSEDICASNPYAIILVDSVIHHNRKRMFMREWLPSLQLENFQLAKIFVMGNYTGNSIAVKKRIEDELGWTAHKDILQGTFPDDIKHRTYKTLMGLRWVTKYCTNASYIIKISEDCRLTLSTTLNFLSRLDELDNNNLIIGHRTVGKIPVRNPQLANLDPNYVSWEEFGGLFFPPFLSGFFYVTTPQVATRLVSEASYHKYLFLEDVFVTGVLTDALKIPVRDINEIKNEESKS